MKKKMIFLPCCFLEMFFLICTSVFHPDSHLSLSLFTCDLSSDLILPDCSLRRGHTEFCTSCDMAHSTNHFLCQTAAVFELSMTEKEKFLIKVNVKPNLHFNTAFNQQSVFPNSNPYQIIHNSFMSHIFYLICSYSCVLLLL